MSLGRSFGLIHTELDFSIVSMLSKLAFVPVAIVPMFIWIALGFI